MTTTNDREKYGVCLKAEPDFRVLGVRLKDALKDMKKSINNLTDAQLKEFQQKGELTVNGHKLGHEDLKIIYSFDGSAKGVTNKYEAHSDNDVRYFPIKICFSIMTLSPSS